MEENWKKIVTNQVLSESFVKVRSRFFNAALFDYDEIVIKKSWKEKLLRTSLNSSIVLAVLVLAFYFLPEGIMKVFPQIENQFIKAEELTQELTNEQMEQIILKQLPERINIESTMEVKPKYDLNFPAGQWLEIKSVGIKTEILTNTNIEETKEVDKLLEKGVYVYPGFSEYGNPEKMAIIAGHHYNMWTSIKQKEQSFQKLDEVQIGDIITVTDNQKQWTYKVKAISKNTRIQDNSADLVLYTCVFWWDSELRLFVYADLVEE